MTASQRTAIGEFLTTQGLAVDGVGTRIERLSRFYAAEEYHQKYKLQSAPSVMDAFEAAGYSSEEFRESPIAAKLNAYVAGHDVGIGDTLTEQRTDSLT